MNDEKENYMAVGSADDFYFNSGIGSIVSGLLSYSRVASAYTVYVPVSYTHLFPHNLRLTGVVDISSGKIVKIRFPFWNSLILVKSFIFYFPFAIIFYINILQNAWTVSYTHLVRQFFTVSCTLPDRTAAVLL